MSEAARPATPPAPLHWWAGALQALESGLLQRDVAARALLLAVLAGEHLLLLGPPGTAKSELARRLSGLVPGAHYFERLLTRFTVPEELFGPLSLKALEADRYERLTEGYLPCAEVAFLDEVFKANSAILNTLLGLLHERQFDNGSQRQPVPLWCLVGASNETPQDDSLRAFFDRFLLRVPVAPVDDAHFAALLQLHPRPGALSHPADSAAANAPHLLNAQALQGLRQQSSTVALPPEVLDHLQQARQLCAPLQPPVSDRRWRKLADLLKVQAASRGATSVSPWDLWLLPYVLAHTPQDADEWKHHFLVTVAQAVPLDTAGLEAAVQAFEGQLDIETRAPASAQDDSAGKLALAQSLTDPNESVESIRMASERARKRYSPVHIATRTAQVDALMTQVATLRDETADTARRVCEAAAAHEWLPPSWRAEIDAAHARRVHALQHLLERLHAVRAGFANLPLDAQAPADAPPPVLTAV